MKSYSQLWFKIMPPGSMAFRPGGQAGGTHAHGGKIFIFDTKTIIFGVKIFAFDAKSVFLAQNPFLDELQPREYHHE